MKSPRIKFTYLYRDACNSKAWGEIVFENPDNLSLEQINEALVNSFETDGLFVAHQINIPEVFLYLNGDLTDADHCFHEFFSVEHTEDPSTDLSRRSISSFVMQVDSISKSGWSAFHPSDRVFEILRTSDGHN